MSRRSRLPLTIPAMGAMLVSLGLAAQPAAAGGHHRGSHARQVWVVTAGGQTAAGVPSGFVSPPPVGSHAAATQYHAAPGYYGSSALNNAAPSMVYYGNYAPAAAPAFGGLVGFAPAETEAYNASPALRTYLGASFPLLHRKLSTHAQALSRNGVKGGQLLNTLKDVALPILGEILGIAVPGSGPIFDEVMSIVSKIAVQTDPTATTPSTVDTSPAPGVGTTINVFLDTKSSPPTATAIVAGIGDKSSTRVAPPVAPIGITPPIAPPNAPPLPPVPAGEEKPSLKDIQATLQQLVNDVNTLKADAAKAKAQPVKEKDKT